MTDWLLTHLNERERLMYRIAITNARQPELVDDSFYFHFVKQIKENEMNHLVKQIKENEKISEKTNENKLLKESCIECDILKPAGKSGDGIISCIECGAPGFAIYQENRKYLCEECYDKRKNGGK